jgi:alkanesulfonate monooxygenase SsuD/methylene tetrahydromethanopterin reductase-like flavin-dependent oxidoreductase (luciferase family)
VKIGAVLPIGEREETEQPYSYEEVRSMALRLEASGFDSLWLPDHFLFRFPEQPDFGVWECWSILTALAEATERIELGTLVLCLPFRNPALLAKMAIATDEVSGGRLILGLGAGWHQPEFEAFGVPFERRADQFEEGLRIIAPLLREGRVDFQGRYFSAPDCEMRPRGPRPGGPPLLVASRGPRMLRLTAEYADQWNAAWFARPESFLVKRAELVRACREVGRDPVTIAVTVGLYVLYPDRLTPQQLETLPESLSHPDKALRGTPEEIAAGLQAFSGLGVDHLICNPVPNTPETLAELTEALRVMKT